MELKKIKIRNKKGFSLVEALIFSLIAVIVVVVFYKTFANGAKVLRDSRARIAASQVANERMEVVRNVPYENLTTDPDDGWHIEEFETLTRSKIVFDVQTEITYVDDDYDNDAEDQRPNDYKQIKVYVKWKSEGLDKVIEVISFVAPPGSEELLDGGVLEIDIHQSDGQPVDNANVVVRKASDGTSLFSDQTMSNGLIKLIGYDTGDAIYEVSVDRSNYYPVKTMHPIDDPSGIIPSDDVHATVWTGRWNKTIVFDKLASFNLKTMDPFGNAIGNIDFEIEGGRNLGTYKDTGLTAYSYEKMEHASNVSGEFSLSGESPGKYIFNYLTTTNNDNYLFWKIEPYYNATRNIFDVAPGQTSNFTIKLLDESFPAIFLKVDDGVTPISDVIVELKSDSLSYLKTQTTDQFGYVYFPIEEGGAITPLLNGEEYQISINEDGYDSIESSPITVSNLTEQTLSLTPSL
ncbi:MAG: hypothetical protein ACD_56C00165G0007 [uncultured bacterium]|nr:MAG: hypothetical protein ACD_56C00165G0007 [uncultured bacterium]